MKARKRKKQIQSNTPGKLNNKAITPEYAPADIGAKYLALSFFLPFAILGTAFALHKVFPFGNRQIIIYDFYHQYYPFLSSLWHKIRDGTLSTWSWTAGAGHDYAALFSYYMASPLNFLALLLPHAWLRETLTFILLLKIGCAGLFTAMFLRNTFKQQNLPDSKSGFALPVFSSLYALCAWVLGYYMNIIWLDSFALLPLVMTGFIALMREGRWRLYIGALALAVLTNFYIGFFICVFTAIAFLFYGIIHKFNLRDFLHKLCLIAACSALALGMTAMLTIPAWSALQNTYSSETAIPAQITLYRNFFSVLGNFIAFTPPTVINGLPNLYCGMISVLLAGLFFVSPKISRREKITLGGIVVFLVLSCNINALDYIMHGFHYPNDLPARFSFLISILLVVMAYRAFLVIETVDKRNFPVIVICAVFFLVSAVFGTQEKSAVIASAVLCVFYLILLLIFSGIKTAKAQTSVKTAFFVLILIELSVTAFIGVKTAGTSSRNEYPDRYVQIHSLLDQRRQSAKDFYRTEIDGLRSFNESSLFNNNGISFYASTADASVTRFIAGLGLPNFIRNSRYWYNETSPLTNAFLNMRYFISRRGDPADGSVYWETISNAGDSELLENRYYLPLSFMVNEEIAGYAHHDSNPFLSQNDLFCKTTGIDSNLFAIWDISSLAERDKERGRTTWDIETPVDGPLYAFCSLPGGSELMDISVNGSLVRRLPMSDVAPYIFTAGCFSQGDIVSLSLKSGNATIYLGFLNKPLFEQGYTILADEPLNLTHFSETKVRGTVTALQDGILYTSIPGRNWQVYVDGVKSELLLIDNAMAAVRLSKGTHEVEFRYLNKSFVAGVVVSIVSVVIFIILILRKKRKDILVVF